jgi:hypothetical protein
LSRICLDVGGVWTAFSDRVTDSVANCFFLELTSGKTPARDVTSGTCEFWKAYVETLP